MALSLENVHFGYGDDGFALSVPGLGIHAGESVALVGPSGSGKTTLLNLIAGILSPDRGSIRLGDEELTALGSRQRRSYRLRRIGMIFQSFELLNYLDVRDNILLPYRINRSLELTADVVGRAEDLAASVGIADKLGRYVDRLSQGERQRVAKTSTDPMLTAIHAMETGRDTALIAGTKWAENATKKPNANPAAITGRANFSSRCSNTRPTAKRAMAEA